MTGEELLQFYKDNVKVTAEVEVVRKPKRYYKRPDLQRLANRWYGMITTEFMDVTLIARPTQQEVRVPFLGKIPVTPKPCDKVDIRIKTYNLKTMGYKFRCTREIYYDMYNTALEYFWASLSTQTPIEET